MGVCDDPLVAALKDAGYNVLAVPREDFAPLALLRSDGRRHLRQLGALDRELGTEGQVPVVRIGEVCPDWAITRTRRLGGSLGAEVLATLLRAVGAPVSAAAELSRDGGAAIELTGVTRDSIVEGDLAAYLEDNVRPRTERTRQLAEAGELFVVTEVLRSRILKVETNESVAARVQASLPVGSPVAPTVQLSSGTEGSTRLSFQGPTPLTFGFRAMQIFHRDGRWSNFMDTKGRIAYAAPASGKPVRRLLILDEDLVEDQPEMAQS